MKTALIALAVLVVVALALVLGGKSGPADDAVNPAASHNPRRMSAVTSRALLTARPMTVRRKDGGAAPTKK